MIEHQKTANNKINMDKIRIPDSLKGPLGTHKNYIAHIALDNCVDYFRLREKNKEEGNNGTSNQYKELRYFLNAVESLNNIFDYMYFETYKENTEQTLNKFKQDYLEKHTELKNISEIANAYKHCIRGAFKNGKFTPNKNSLHASDLTENTIHFTVNMSVDRPLTELQYSFKGIDSEKTLKKAFRYWVNYINNDIPTQENT